MSSKIVGKRTNHVRRRARDTEVGGKLEACLWVYAKTVICNGQRNTEAFRDPRRNCMCWRSHVSETESSCLALGGFRSSPHVFVVATLRNDDLPQPSARFSGRDRFHGAHGHRGLRSNVTLLHSAIQSPSGTPLGQTARHACLRLVRGVLSFWFLLVSAYMTHDWNGRGRFGGCRGYGRRTSITTCGFQENFISRYTDDTGNENSSHLFLFGETLLVLTSTRRLETFLVLASTYRLAKTFPGLTL